MEYRRQALQYYFECHRVSQGMIGKSFVHDPLAMLIAEDASLGEYKMLRAGVEYKSPELSGKIITDGRFQSTMDMDQDEIAVCVRVDSERAIRRLFLAFHE